MKQKTGLENVALRVGRRRFVVAERMAHLPSGVVVVRDPVKLFDYDFTSATTT